MSVAARSCDSGHVRHPVHLVLNRPAFCAWPFPYLESWCGGEAPQYTLLRHCRNIITCMYTVFIIAVALLMAQPLIGFLTFAALSLR